MSRSDALLEFGKDIVISTGQFQHSEIKSSFLEALYIACYELILVHTLDIVMSNQQKVVSSF